MIGRPYSRSTRTAWAFMATSSVALLAPRRTSDRASSGIAGLITGRGSVTQSAIAAIDVVARLPIRPTSQPASVRRAPSPRPSRAGRARARRPRSHARPDGRDVRHPAGEHGTVDEEDRRDGPAGAGRGCPAGHARRRPWSAETARAGASSRACSEPPSSRASSVLSACRARCSRIFTAFGSTRSSARLLRVHLLDVAKEDDGPVTLGELVDAPAHHGARLAPLERTSLGVSQPTTPSA